MFDEVLSQTAKVVYCNLLSHVKKGTNKCKLYISTIAEEVKRSVRTVRRALSQLCERGVIVRLMQYGNKQNQLASLFVIIGKNAACYQEGGHKATEQGLPSGTKTASLPKVSGPHAKNGIQNNDKGGNKSILKDTLIGQAELPKLSSSLSSSPSHQFHRQKSQLPRERTCKKLQNGYDDPQILIDFDAQEIQEAHQEIQEPNKSSGQKERLTDLPVVEALITSESVSEDLLSPEEVKADGVANSANCPDKTDSNCTFDPLACVQDADKIPNDMLDTARYFLYRTGRDPRTINEKEIQAMREVFLGHYPARIQKEIDVACRRFVKNGKSLKVLFFGYIATALRKQQSLVPYFSF